MNNILDTELITDEQMLSLTGGDSCVSCTQTEKLKRGDSKATIKPEVDLDLGDLLESDEEASE